MGNLDGELADPLIGQRLGHYLVLAPIGRGGMGVVYRAEDVRLHRVVALKLLTPGQSSDEIRQQRLLREARLLAGLRHPSLPVVFDVGVEQGQVFLAMELIDGTPLRDVLQRGPLSAARAVSVAVDVAGALAVAHEAGVVHRDIKPDNVMITRDGKAKLLDFGIARALPRDDETADGTRSQGLTREGAVVGTPAYLSPEQARGEAATAASDVYALALLLVECLLGRRPDTAALENLAALPALPEELTPVLQRALRLSPTSRYVDGGELRAALEAVASASQATAVAAPSTNEAHTSAAPTPATRTQAPSRVKASRARLALVGVAVAVVGGVLAVRAWLEHSASTSTAVASAAVKERRLTARPAQAGFAWGAIEPDGNFVMLVGDGGYAEVLDLRNERRVPLPDPPRGKFAGASMEADGSIRVRSFENDAELWWRYVPATGAMTPEARPTLDAEAGTLWRGPTGIWLFRRADGLYVADPDGGNPRRIAARSQAEIVEAMDWSADGASILVTRKSPATPGKPALELVELHGGEPRTMTLLTDERLVMPEAGTEMAVFTARDRVLYALRNGPGEDRATELWTARIERGVGLVEARLLHRIPGAFLSAGSYSARTARLVAQRNMAQEDVYEASLAGARDPLAPRRLTPSDFNEIPIAWTRDGGVLIAAERRGQWELQRLSREGGPPQPLGHSWPHPPVDLVASPGDGGTLLVLPPSEGAGPARLAYERDGVVTDLPSASAVARLRAHIVRCAARAPICIHTVQLERGDALVEEIDVRSGAVRPLPLDLRSPEVAKWDLSPDGAELVLLPDSDDQYPGGRRVVFIPLSDGGRVRREVVLDLPRLYQSVAWHPAGQGLLLTGMRAEKVDALSTDTYGVFFADRGGKVTSLLTTTHEWLHGPLPSPDGRQLVFRLKEFDSDVWLFEGL